MHLAAGCSACRARQAVPLRERFLNGIGGLARIYSAAHTAGVSSRWLGSLQRSAKWICRLQRTLPSPGWPSRK